MKEAIKKYFIPHEGNDYHPHILHPKRAIFYSLFFVLLKGLLVLFVLLLPTQVFVLPEVLTTEQIKLINLTNDLRAKNYLPSLKEEVLLDKSAYFKAEDMAVNKYFSHTGPDNHNLAYFLNQAGYPYNVAGENLAMGFTSAEEVLAAWIKSPTHYANLLDRDYEELGVGLEMGNYGGESVVYVAEHFGQRASGGKVLASKGVAKTVLDETKSFVAWEKIGEDITRLKAEVAVQGPVKTAYVEVGDIRIPLQEEVKSGVLRGEQAVIRPVESFFTIVVSPIVKIESPTGEQIVENVPWKEVLVVSPTPVEKYVRAKSVLGGITGIFKFSDWVYYGFIGFFALALGLMIGIEARRQHHHIIAQTLAVLMLLVVLVLI